MQKLALFIIFLSVSNSILAQQHDSIVRKSNLIPKISLSNDSSTIFKSKKKWLESDSIDMAELKIGGYVSTYYAYYDDETSQQGFVQFPTMAPRNKEFGLNMALIDMHYTSKHIRGNMGLHFGDIAQSVWPQQYNMIQEANAGVKLVKRLWLDAGFFRSHIGVESTQPRENITSSMSLVNVYEPYYFAGAKLTYELNSKLSLQVNAFNSYASLVDNNKNKLIGTSITYAPNDNLSLTYNFLTGNENPDSIKIKQQRNYNNFYLTFTSNKILVAAEANYGWQTNSLKKDSTKSAKVYSGLIVVKYQAFKKIGFYGREEIFSDVNQVLTGTTNIGNFTYGTTLGFEYKPYKKMALSVEDRLLQCDNLIFKQGNNVTNYRNEVIFCLDLWF